MADLVVVGAGPAGAALAYLLARRGLAVTLVERQSDFAREFRGEVLMPSGIDALGQMGLGDDFAALPQARPTLIDFHLGGPGGRFAQRLELPELVGTGPRMVSQPALLEMLVERAAAFPGFRLLRGVAVAGLLEEAGRVRGVTLRGDAPGELRADLVVAADGRASTVRRRLGLEPERSLEAFDVVWFKLPYPDGQPELRRAVQVHLRPAQACLAFPAFDDRLQVGWIIPKGSFGDLRERGREHWLRAIAAQVGEPLGAHLLAHGEVLERPFLLDVVCYHLPAWQRPGALLLGDACHPMSPVGGQGLNVALRDALVAANHLIPALEAGAGPEALDAAARAVQTERLPEIVELQRLQHIPPRLFFRHGLGVWALLALGSLLLRLPALRRRARPPRIAQRFLHGVTEVKLRV